MFSRSSRSKLFDRARSIYAYMVRMLVTSPSRFAYERSAPRIVEKLMPAGASCLVLDAGCGNGRYAPWFASHVYIGVDIEKHDFIGAGNSSFCVGDLAALPFPDSAFDAIFSSFALEHIADVRAALAELHRSLKPAGGLFLSTGSRHARIVGEMHRFFWKESDPDIGQAHHYFDTEELAASHRGAGFVDISIHRIGGPAALFLEILITFVRLLAMKCAGASYSHRRTSDETQKARRPAERNSISRLGTLALVSLLFIPRFLLHWASFLFDLLCGPRRNSKFIAVTARKKGNAFAKR